MTLGVRTENGGAVVAQSGGHMAHIPPTLKVKASTPRSRGGEVETDR